MTGFAGAPRISARGLILDADGRYVLLRRTRSDQGPYLVVPGGGVGDGESLEDAIRRECAEELGATVVVGDVVYVAYQDEPAPGGLQRFLLCGLESIDDASKTGHEFREPGRGTYETVRVASTDPALLDLRPPELARLIRRYHPYFVDEVARLR